MLEPHLHASITDEEETKIEIQREREREREEYERRRYEKRKAKLGERHSSWSRNERRQPLENLKPRFVHCNNNRMRTIKLLRTIHFFTFSASEFLGNTKRRAYIKFN